VKVFVKMIKIATPISSLFSDKSASDRIIDSSDCLECRDHSIEMNFDNEEVFHCEVQPIHNLENSVFEYLKKVRDSKPQLKLISFHLGSCYHTPGVQNGVFVPGGYKYSIDEMFKNASLNFSRIFKIFGSEMLFSVENNNYFKTDAYSIVTDNDFISRIVKDNGLKFLLDISHAKITSINKGILYEDYKSGLPLDQLIQIHISKHGLKDDGNPFDAHEAPDDEEFLEVKKILNEFHAKYLTIEYYRNVDKLISLNKRLREYINGE
jgi:uncharacterized protein (UPF0276 family)